MTQTQQQRNGQTAQAADKSETPIIDKMLDHQVTYKPFMSDDDITLTPRMVLKYFAKPTKSGKVCTNEQAAGFVKLCQARALNPWEGDAFVVGFDNKDGTTTFNLITAHQAFLKRAEVHPEYDGMESGVTVNVDGDIKDVEGDMWVDGSEVIGGWCRVHLKQRKIPMYKRLKLATFNTNRSRWNVDPAGMIVKCAEADALRSAFPTKLGGMYLNEEFDAMRQAEQHRPIAMPQGISERMPTNGESGTPESEQPEEARETANTWNTELDCLFNDLSSAIAETGDMETLNKMLANCQSDFATIRKASAEAFAKLTDAITAKRDELAAEAPAPVKPAGKKARSEMFAGANDAR